MSRKPTKRGEHKDVGSEHELDALHHEMESKAEVGMTDHEKAVRKATIDRNNTLASTITTSTTTTFQSSIKDTSTHLYEETIDQGPSETGNDGDPAASKNLANDFKENQSLNKVEDRHKESKASRTLKWQYTTGTVAALSGLATTANIIYNVVAGEARRASGSGQRSEFDTEEARRLVTAWNSKPDADFWEEVANFFEKNPQIALIDEANALKVIMNMCLDRGDIWVSDKEFDRAVGDFSRDIQEGNTAPAYREVMTRKYAFIDAASVPRMMSRRIASEVLCLAISRYLRSRPQT